MWIWAEVNTSDMCFISSNHLLNDESQWSKHPLFLQERAWQDSRCFLGQLFLHGRPSRPPTYLVATPGIWCFEKPRSSADSDRQGLCVLSVWKRQTGPGICFQLLSLRRHRLAHGDVALHTHTQPAPEEKKHTHQCGVRLKDQFVNTLGRHCPAITSWMWSSQCEP